jgi:triose/dihydroxyacetone kinase / FAD-AMP lyase (cyclizing)
LISIAKSIHKSLVAAEPEITRLDLIMGDGDCGTTLLGGSRGVLEALDKGIIDAADLPQGLMALADVISQCMGGTSGALYGVFFTAFASSICTMSKERRALEFELVADALLSALESLKQVTAARQGDRTMMDALIPFVETLAASKAKGSVEAIELATLEARGGCEGTRNIESKFGRSTYVSAEESDGATKGLADPGAYGIVAIAEGILAALR